MNPLSNLVSNFTNPKQIAMNMIMKNSGNPQINNLMNMINNNDTKGIKNMAEEVAQKNGMTLREFIETHKLGTYLVTMRNHITCVIDGEVYDTWNCLDKNIWCAWYVA